MTDDIDVTERRNCMGHPLIEYELPRPVGADLAHALRALGQAEFPFGQRSGMLRLDAPGRYLLTAVLGSCCVRVTMRLGAQHAARQALEDALDAYCGGAA